MRLFLEAYQSDARGTSVQVMALDETGKDTAFLQADIALAKEAYPKVYLHRCFHDEGKPCPPLEEV